MTATVLALLLVVSLAGNAWLVAARRTARRRVLERASTRRPISPDGPPVTAPLPAPPLRTTTPATAPPGPSPPSAGGPVAPGNRARDPVQPRTLPRDPEPVADSAVDGAAAGSLVIRAASVRGHAHRRQGEVRRDTFRFRALDGLSEPALLAVVAAGRPGGRLSQVAADDACRHVFTCVENFPVAIPEAWRLGDRRALTDRLTDVLSAVATHLRGPVKRVTHDPDEHTVELTCLLTELRDTAARRYLAFGVGSGDLLLLHGDRWQGRAERGVPGGAGEALPHRFHPWIEIGTVGHDPLVLATGPAGRFVRETAPDDWRRPPDLLPFLWRLSTDPDESRTGPDRTAVALWPGAGA